MGAAIVLGRKRRFLQICPVALACAGLLMTRSASLSADGPQLTPQQQVRLKQASQLDSEVDGHFNAGKNREAIPPLAEILKIHREVLGPRHSKTVSSMNNLAVAHAQLGHYAEARQLLEETLAIQRELLPESDRRLSATLTNLGVQYENLEDFSAARKHYEEAVALEVRYRGDGHDQTGIALTRLGSLLQTLGSYSQAQPYLERSLSIYRQLYGEKHASTARALNNLGTLLRDKGDFAGAKAYFESALAIMLEVLGDRHPSVSAVLNNLAFLSLNVGDHATSRAYYEQALKNMRALYGEEHPDVALMINNIGEAYARQGDAKSARRQFEQALAIRRKVLGDEHGHTAASLSSLGELSHEEGEAAQSRAYFAEALRIYQKVLGEMSLPAVTTEAHLASLLAEEGDLAGAQALNERVFDAYCEILGDSHPFPSRVLSSLSELHAQQGQWAEAGARADQGRRVVRRHAAGILAGLSEREQLLYLTAENSGPLHAGLSWGVARPSDASMAALSAGWLVNGKGLIQEALSQRVLLSRDSRDPRTAETSRQLLEVRQQLAALAFSSTPAKDDATRRRQLVELEAAEDVLARRLLPAGNPQERRDPWVELDSLRAKIEASAMFIDIARFPVFNSDARPGQDQWHPPRYAAWLIPPADAGNVVVVDLGPAADIDAAIDKVRASIEAPEVIREQGEAEAETLARAALTDLSQRLLAPLLAALPEGTNRLLISPDAKAWLVPWSALSLPDGRYAVEKYEIQYLVSGRELMQEAESTAAKARPVIMADPNFDLGRKEALASTQAVLRKQFKPESGSGTRSASAEQGLPKVARLPGTAAEAAAVAPKLAAYAGAEPLLYTDSYALEGVFKVLKRPQTLVLSTHGFFLEDQPIPAGGTAPPSLKATGAAALTGGLQLENPLVRCGLLLAGCNGRESGGAIDDGVLTGLEIVGTDLRGTELVVLSACQTGLGQINNGEGVAGLRQAFQLAGARDVVASLWQIPDRETALLMADFFDQLSQGAGKAAALRAAQLKRMQAQREENGAAHPYFWAAFTLTGQ